MGEIVTVCKEFCGFELKYVVVDSEPWFKGKVVANALGYVNTKLAIIDHVESSDKKTMEELMGISQIPMDYQTRTSLYINESGLYSLIMKSTKPDAKLFQQWVTKEMRPSIRKTRSYEIPAPIPTPLPLENLQFLDLQKIKDDNSIFSVQRERVTH